MNDEHDIEEEGLEAEVVERRLDWALGEVVGDERAPDVVMAVMTRRAAALVESQQVRVTGRGGPLLNAAVLVLGLVVVAWVMFASRAIDEAGAPGGQDPQFVVVTTMAQLRDLPADTRAVELQDLGDEGFLALAKQCPTLERLRVRGRGPDLRSFAVLGEGGGYGELVEADLTGCADVQDVFVAKLIEPKTMARVALGGTAVTAAVVPFLEMAPQLRSVDFGEAPWLTLEMVEQLLMGGKRVRLQRPGDADFLRQVEALTQRYAGVLDRPFYHVVRTLAELKALSRNASHIELRGLGDEATALLVGHERLRGVAYVGDDDFKLSGVSMRQLGAMQQLEELRIMVQRWNGIGVEHLAGMTGLRKLEISGIRDEPMGWLGSLTSLRELSLWHDLDEDTMAAIVRLGELEDLHLVFGSKSRDPADRRRDDLLPRLVEVRQLRRLKLPGEACGPATIAAIARLIRLEELDLSCTAFDRGSGYEVCSMPSLQPLADLSRLVSLRLSWARLEPETVKGLPFGLKGLRIGCCSGLDANDCVALRDRFPQLVSLELDQPEWLDDERLRTILGSPSITSLTVTLSKRTTTAVLPSILAAENLRYIDGSWSTFLEAAAVETLRRERPDLQVVRKVW